MIRQAPEVMCSRRRIQRSEAFAGSPSTTTAPLQAHECIVTAQQQFKLTIRRAPQSKPYDDVGTTKRQRCS
jgi:hypothetical protein